MFRAVATCNDYGAWITLPGGSIDCKCVPWRTGGVMVTSVCGDGVIDPMHGEQCEVANLMNASCTSLGFLSGNLKCDPLTCHFDTSSCINEVP
jgi:hypothetical protein